MRLGWCPVHSRPYGSVITEMEGALWAFRGVIDQVQRGVPAEEILLEKHLADVTDGQRRLVTLRQHVDDLKRFFGE